MGYVITSVEHQVGDGDSHPADECPKDDTCPVYAEMKDHPILGRLVR